MMKFLGECIQDVEMTLQLYAQLLSSASNESYEATAI